MGQRNMPYTSPMIDLEMDQQGQGNLHHEPCVLYRSITSFPQPNNHTILPAPGNRTNFDVHHLPDHHSALSYGMTPYNGVQHHHPAGNLELSVATASSHYNMYMTPPSVTRVFPVPLVHGPHDQLPFSSTNGIVEVSADSYGRNSHFLDGVGHAFKRKNAEGILGNLQYGFVSAGSSSSVAPMSATPLESNVGSHGSIRNISGSTGVDSLLGHNTNHLLQGSYPGQPFQTAGTPWLDQQFSSNCVDIGTLSWNQAPALPYMHGSINGGCMEAPNMGVQGYQVAANMRSSTTFLHPPPIPQGHTNLHHPPPSPMQGVQGHNINFHSQLATSSRRLFTNSTSHTCINPFQDSVEAGPRFVGPVPPTGLRVYRPHRREAMLEATPRQRNLPHLRVLPEDGVAILEISDYHEVGDSIDHHRDMRLDIDHMSYEELLALGEQIGTVGSGLSEETVSSHLKTRTFVASTSCSHLEEAACVDQELNFCVICQADYKNQEKIGILSCGHKYHVDCIKKWLLVKNLCPICKSLALNTERKES